MEVNEKYIDKYKYDKIEAQWNAIGLLNGIADPYHKSCVAVLLEN